MVDISDHNCLCGMRLARLPTWVTGERPTGKRDAHVRPHERSEVDDAGRASMEVQAVHQANQRQAPQWNLLGADLREAVEVVPGPSVSRQCLCAGGTDRWDNVPDDPIYRLTFPHRDMLREPEYAAIRDLLSAGASEAEIQQRVHAIRMRMNPHPAGQMTHNVPQLDGCRWPGCSTSTKKRCCSFPAPGRPAMPIARSASAGRSSWAWKS